MSEHLQVDEGRATDYMDATGYYVRALYRGKWGSHDIAQLDKASLMRWLRSRGGDNPWAEEVVAGLLNHKHDSADEH